MNVDDIEEKIAQNEMTPMQVFTQMKQHIHQELMYKDLDELESITGKNNESFNTGWSMARLKTNASRH